MTESMQHEDFYKAEMFSVPEMGIHAGGVALEKSFAENSVLFNEDKSIVLIFSGECFLDPQIGEDLKTEGHLISENKAHWLPHFYEMYGESFFEKLNGIFSGLVIDRQQQKAFLFNDRYGLSRIYVHESNGDFYFASEAKALLRILPELRQFDREGVAEFLACGCPLDWKTIFRGVKILPGGSRWTFENGECKRESYFSPEDWKNLPELSPAEFESQFLETFDRILPRYFESNDKPGISLTAGLDTRMIMARLPESNRDPISYTFTGPRGETLDDKIASRVAETCGLEHELLRLTPKFFSDFAGHVDRTVFLTDGYFGLTGAHEIFLNRQARELAPTRLTGVFGGEILRGVSTFKPTGILRELIQAELHPQMNLAEQRLNELKNHQFTFAAFSEVPWSLFGAMKASASQVNFRSPYLDNELVRLAHQTPQQLQKSSAPAVNLVKQFNPQVAKIPTDMSAFANSAQRLFSKITFKLDYICNDGLPNWLSPFDSIFDSFCAHKFIFGHHKFLRYRRWLRRELSGYLTKALALVDADDLFLNKKFVDQMAQYHLRGRKNLLPEINAVLTLNAVQRTLFRDLPRTENDFSISEIRKSARKNRTIAGQFAGYKNEVLT